MREVSLRQINELSVNDNSIQRKNVQSKNKIVIKKLKNCGGIRIRCLFCMEFQWDQKQRWLFASDGDGCKVADLKCLFVTCCDLMITHYSYWCKNTSWYFY